MHQPHLPGMRALERTALIGGGGEPLDREPVALAAHQVFECLYWLFCPFGDALGVCSQAYLPELLGTKERLARAEAEMDELEACRLQLALKAVRGRSSRASVL